MVNAWLGGHSNNDAGDPLNWGLGIVPNSTQDGVFATGVMVVRGQELASANILIGFESGAPPPTLVLKHHAQLTATTLTGPLTVVVHGTDTLDISRGIATGDSGGSIVTVGTIHDHLNLSGVLNFGTYTQYGAELVTRGISFTKASILLDCNIEPSATNNQVGAYSGSRMEINGKVDRHVMVVAAGTGQTTENIADLGGEGGLIIDNSRKFEGFAALEDGFEQLRDLSCITSYKLVDIPTMVFQDANVAVQLFSGNKLVKTALLYEAGGVGPQSGHNIQVAAGHPGALTQGTFIYDASDAQMAGFGLTKLPLHA